MSKPYRPGTVYWFTGLSGSGKSTLGRLFFERLRAAKSNTVFLDGNDLRKMIASDLGFDFRDRKKSAMRNARLCKFLADHGINVVCATISLWHDCHRWNRKNLHSYKEIFIQAPLVVLEARDRRRIYSRARRGRLKNVWGVDLKPQEPKNPDAVITNDGLLKPSDIVNSLCRRFRIL